MTPNVQHEIDAHFLHMACRAAPKSPDPSTKNGACLACVDGSVHVDCNRFSTLPTDVKPTPEFIAGLLADRDLKLDWIEHAERNVLFSAIRSGAATGGSTLYCPFLACVDCARAIKLLGVKTVVRMPREKFGGWPESWRAKIERADRIMQLGGVTIREYTGPDLGVDYLVNKTLWRI